MSGGGGGGPTTTTTNTSNLPSYLEPAVTANVQAAQAAANTPYQAYGNPRIAGFNPNQQQTQQSTMDMQTPGQYGQATQATQGAMGRSWTDPGVAQSFMNPYQQNVTDVANQLAARNSNTQATYDNAQFGKAGAFGGSRQGIVDAERERNLMFLQNQNQVQGANNAWNSGMGQYNTQQGMQLQGANQLASIGGQQQQADLARLQAQAGVGAQQQGLEQQQMTQSYQDFLNQQNWAKNQQSYMAGILHGTPSAPSSTMTEAAPPPNLAAQLTGLGVAGLGVAKAIG